MNEFKVGDKVLVKVAARTGHIPDRQCTVVEVVLAGRVPKKRGFYSAKKYDHQSYIVQDAEGERYRPIVSRMSRVEPQSHFGNGSGLVAEPKIVDCTFEPAKAPPITEYIFCLDASGSMSSARLEEPTRLAFNAQIAAIKASSVGEVWVTVYTFGSQVRQIHSRARIQDVEPMTHFRATEGATCLFRCIARAIAKATDPLGRASFVLQVLTDGGENVFDVAQETVAKAIAETVATDRWTHAIMIPRGHRESFLKQFPSIPAGNVVEWDTTPKGAEEVGQKATAAATEYMKSRSLGVTRSRNYFQPDLSAVTEADLAKCVDLSRHFKRYEVVGAETTLRELVEDRTKEPYVLGSAYYQLTKRESDVQGYKQVLLWHRASGRIFGGAEARKLIGLQVGVDARVEPGNHAGFEIYIESTSINRIAPRGSHVLHDHARTVGAQPTWDHVGAHAAAEARKNANGTATAK